MLCGIYDSSQLLRKIWFPKGVYRHEKRQAYNYLYLHTIHIHIVYIDVHSNSVKEKF